MKAIDIAHAEIGTVSSRADGSIAFRVITPELRPSEAGAVMAFHGKACRVLITPDESSAPDEVVTVTTAREVKTPGQRLRAVIFLLWRSADSPGVFDHFYSTEMEKFITHVKAKLPQP